MLGSINENQIEASTFKSQFVWSEIRQCYVPHYTATQLEDLLDAYLVEGVTTGHHFKRVSKTSNPERENIVYLKDSGLTNTEIADETGRHLSTVGRVLKRMAA